MQDINLYHLLKFYAKKWRWIVLLTVLGAIAGFVYSAYIQIPLYKSDATLLLVSTTDRKIGQDSTLINNYIELLKSRRVLEPVISEQGHSISYDELVASTAATNEKNTEVIKVSIASKNPETSKMLTDGVIVSFKKEVKALYNVDNISIVDNASKADQPYNVHTVMLVILTTVAGFFASIIGLFFIYDLVPPVKKNPRGRPKKQIAQQSIVNRIRNVFVKPEVEVKTKPIRKPKSIKKTTKTVKTSKQKK